jgi:hypothetical protein
MFHILIPAALATFGPFGAAIGSMTLMQSFLVRTAIGLALNALAPKPNLASTTARGYNVTQRGTALDHQIIYGKTKVAGAIVFDATTGSSNKYLHRVLAMAGHEIEGYEEVWLNDYKLTLDGNGEVTSATNDGGTTTTTRYNGYVRVNKHLGSSTQSYDTDLESEVTEWTTDHTLKGIAYLYVRYKFDAEVFPNGVPEIKAVIKGKKVYDPRNSTTAWSDNPALIIRDYLTSSDYGLGEAAAQIDDETVKSSANRCDETASNGDKFFTCNGAFTTAQTPYDTLQDLLSSMIGELWYSQGAWRMKAADYVAPTLTLDENDLRGSLSISTRHSRRDNFNVIKGTWRGEDSDWQITDYPEFKVAQAITDDGGSESVLDYPLNFTTNPDECQRIARILYERQRQQLVVKATFGLNAFKLQVGDTVSITNERMSWSSKPFEVTDFQFRIEGADELLVELTLRETASTVYDEITQYSTYEKDNTTIASPFDTQAVTIATPVASSSLNGDGTVVPKIRWTWSVSDESAVDYYIFGWRIGASGTYNEFVVTDKLFEIEPAVAGATYYYFVKSVSHTGVSSTIDASSSGNVAAVNDSTAPALPTLNDPVGGYRTITLSWPLPTESDFRHMEIQRSNASGGTYSTVGYSSGTSWVDSDVGDEVTRYYKIRAIDYSDNASSYTSAKSATTNAELQDASLYASLSRDDRFEPSSGLSASLSNMANSSATGDYFLMQTAGTVTLTDSTNTISSTATMTFDANTQNVNYIGILSPDEDGANSAGQLATLDTVKAGSSQIAYNHNGNKAVFDVTQVFDTIDIIGDTLYLFEVSHVSGSFALPSYSDGNDVSFEINYQLKGAVGTDGARGAGRWNISVSAVNAGSFVTGTTYWITTVGTTDFTAIGASANTVGLSFVATGAGSGTGTATPLPTTSSAANTAFTADVGNPVDRDQGWFYAGTEGSPVAQSVWIYTESTDTWNEQTEVIDGNLLVDGTITADKIAISDESANSRIEIAPNKILVYNGGVLRVKIGDLS